VFRYVLIKNIKHITMEAVEDTVEAELLKRWGLKIGPESRELLAPEAVRSQAPWTKTYKPTKRIKLLGRNFHQNGGIADDFHEFKAISWSCYWRNLRRCSRTLTVQEMAIVLNRAVHGILCRKSIDWPMTAHRRCELDRVQRAILCRARPVRRVQGETNKQYWTRSSKRVAQTLLDHNLCWSGTWSNQQTKWHAHIKRHKHDLPYSVFRWHDLDWLNSRRISVAPHATSTLNRSGTRRPGLGRPQPRWEEAYKFHRPGMLS